MLKASCHCGAVCIEISRLPETLTSCDCSICRRYATLWAYYPPSEVRITAASDATAAYSWGRASIEFVRCASCGCVSHWQGVNAERKAAQRMGVNMRLFEPAQFAGVRIRRLDGAVTESYLD